MKSAKQLQMESGAKANAIAQMLDRKPQLYCVIVGSVLGNSEFVPMTTLNEASAAYRAFIEAHCLGASEAGECLIYHGNKVVAHVSYNGRVWEGEGYNPNAKPIFEPCAS